MILSPDGAQGRLLAQKLVRIKHKGEAYSRILRGDLPLAKPCEEKQPGSFCRRSARLCGNKDPTIAQKPAQMTRKFECRGHPAVHASIRKSQQRSGCVSDRPVSRLGASDIPISLPAAGLSHLRFYRATAGSRSGTPSSVLLHRLPTQVHQPQQPHLMIKVSVKTDCKSATAALQGLALAKDQLFLRRTLNSNCCGALRP